MSKVIGWAMVAVAILCVALIGWRVSVISSLSELGVFNPAWRRDLMLLFFGGVVAPIGFAAVLLWKK